MKLDNLIVTGSGGTEQTSKDFSEPRTSDNFIVSKSRTIEQDLPPIVAAWESQDQLQEYLTLLRAAIAPNPRQKPLYIELPNSSPDWACWYCEQEFEGVAQ